jgi:hypothetical protein
MPCSLSFRYYTNESFVEWQLLHRRGSLEHTLLVTLSGTPQNDPSGPIDGFGSELKLPVSAQDGAFVN